MRLLAEALRHADQDQSEEAGRHDATNLNGLDFFPNTQTGGVSETARDTAPQCL
jgi:hypothetical protein